jgi:hypothetical protein
MRVVVSCLGDLSHPLVVSCQGIGDLKRARDTIKRLLAVMQHRALQRAWELMLTATSQSVYQRQWQETSATQHSAVTVSLLSHLEHYSLILVLRAYLPCPRVFSMISPNRSLAVSGRLIRTSLRPLL